ncbi:hypothetical protein ID853_13280 [Xenorhabdus sp. Vera]|nr:hypothetical protein [Xenorhabdus sp. Vera]
MTNALNIACQLADFKDIEVIVLGGVVHTNSYSLHGFTAEQQLFQYRFNTAHSTLVEQGVDVIIVDE